MLKSRIYTIRGVKVMLDADLAEIYGYETKAFNRQVKNNNERFPEEFRFQLTKTDMENCPRCKICTLDRPSQNNKRGSNIKYFPYAFTEQGIYMLMTVLKGDLAIRQSMALIRLFKQMDIADHSVNISELSGEVHNVQDRLGRIDLNLQKVMENVVDPSTYKHFLILNGHKLEDIEGYRPMFEELWAQKTPL